MRRVLRGLCLGLLVAALVGGLGGSEVVAAGAQPGAESFFVFATNQPGAAALYAVQRDGFGIRRLTLDIVGYCSSPAISPDGTFVVYSTRERSQHRLWRVNIDGSGRECMTLGTEDEMLARFSPDGQRLIYASSRDAGMGVRLWTMAVDGSDRRVLTDDPMRVEQSPCYSPDGQYVVFTGYRDVGRPSLWRYDLRSGDRRRIAEAGSDGYWAMSMFAPDGGRLVAEYRASSTRSWHEAYVLNPDGSQRRRVGPRRKYVESPCFVDNGQAIGYADRMVGAIYVQKIGSDERERVVYVPGKPITELTFWEPRG